MFCNYDKHERTTKKKSVSRISNNDGNYYSYYSIKSSKNLVEVYKDFVRF